MHKEEISKMKASMNFVKQVVAASAKECFGVIGIARKTVASKIMRLVAAYNDKQGINITETEDGKLTIDIYVIVAFGVRIVAVAENLISTIKYNVEKQTDRKVKEINVYVRNVRA
jgi:uncharacterized alkaline shock family protein YloU